MSITVATQDELDAALAGDESDIIISSPRGVWLQISSDNGKWVEAFGSASVRASDSASVTAYGSASVRAYGSASVRAFGSASVRASDSASVTAYDSASVTAFGSASVRASDSASVTAYGSASVRAYGSASVRAFGSASVRASDSASVTAYDSASVTASGSASVTASDSASVTASDSASVTATKYVAIHIHSKRVKLDGGVVIDVTALDRSNVEEWAAYHGAEIIDGEVIVHKAVNDRYESERRFKYPVGETVTCPDWKAGDFCGNGLHLSPHPHHAQCYYDAATKFLRCAVPINELTVIDGNSSAVPKLKARVVRVLAEVDIDGNEITNA